ncbi:capping complex subunit for YIEGIA [Anaerocolumna aminovalerica]
MDSVITGNPLALYITDENEKQQCIRDLEIALKADVIQLKNGDYILISR